MSIKVKKIPYKEALAKAHDLLRPQVGREFNGWVFNGGTPYETKDGGLLMNLRIDPVEYMSPIDQAKALNETGMEETIKFLTEVGVINLGRWIAVPDEAIAQQMAA